MKRSLTRRQIALRLGFLAACGVTALALLRFTPLAELTSDGAQEAWLDLLERLREMPAAPLVVILASTVLSMLGLPITPMILAIGALFGIWPGAVYIFATLLLSATMGYWFGRTVGHDLTQQLLGQRLQLVQRALGRRGFWNLVSVRYVPIPFLLANIGLALCSVRWRPFISSTAVAFTPVSFIWAFVAGSFVQATDPAAQMAGVRNLGIALVVLLAFSLIPPRIIGWRRSNRYRELRRQRSGR